MQALIGPLRELAEFEEIQKHRMDKAGVIQITGCVNSQKTHLMYALSDGCKYKVIACSSESKAKQVYEEYRFLDSNVYYYPAKDFLFYQADLRGKELLRERMGVVKALLEQETITVVTSFDGFMDALLPKETIRKRVLRISGTGTMDFEEVQKQLSFMGYDRESQVEGPGQFAVRGGILDVYPLTEDSPVRIELWGDEVDSVRTFDVDSQRSIENLEEVLIYPADEFMQEEAGRVSFLDYFEQEHTLLFLDEPVRLIEKGEAVEQEFAEAQAKRVESGYQVTEEEMKLYRSGEVAKKMNQYSSIGFSALETRAAEFKIREKYSLEVKGVNPYHNSFDTLTRDLKRLKRNGYRVVLLSGSRTRAKRLAEDFRDYNLSSFYSDDLGREVGEGEIMTARGYAAEGYEYPMLKFMVISETDIF